MLWGGLKPIRTRFVLDMITLTALVYSVQLRTSSHAVQHTSILALSCLLTMVTAGITKRWTISLFLGPVVALQLSRYYWTETEPGIGIEIGWAAVAVKIVSFTLLAISFLLTILFPAVRIDHVEGKYKVGVIDLHIPVDHDDHDRVSVRLFYPAQQQKSGHGRNGDLYRMPYFNVDTADKVCKALMTTSAPPPLNKLNFMLDQWKLSTICAKRNAAPFVPKNDKEGGKNLSASTNANANAVNTEEKDFGEEKKDDDSDKEKSRSRSSGLPIIVYSHGITGSAEVYSYQAMSLAADGSLVMSITHSDGSSIGMKRHDGSFLDFDKTGRELAEKEGYAESVRHRRKQLEYRAAEFVASTQALFKLNQMNIPELEKMGISFVGKLNINDCIAAGHSFGAATALAACHRNTELFTACVAHDPAFDWCPDDCRKALLSDDRLKDSRLTYKGGTGGYENVGNAQGNNSNIATMASSSTSTSIHDLDLMFLYSGQWKDYGWGEYRLFQDLFKRGLLGRPHGPTDFGFVYNANHSEFSDSCMKIPLWLARPVKMTGPRNPHETAEEIYSRTATFIAEVRQQQPQSSREKVE